MFDSARGKRVLFAIFMVGFISIACSDEKISPEEICKDIACSNHGHCVAVNEEATCVCDAGYHNVDLACDPGMCEEGDTRPGITPCGENNASVLEQICTDGRWQDTENCVAPASCHDNEVRAGSTLCGRNNRGALEQSCVGGKWQDSANCADPDVCTDNATQTGTTPCGLNNRGALDQTCTLGQWQDTNTCVDPDICIDNATQAGTTPCGFNNRGILDLICTAGQWQDSNVCVDPDVCTDNGTQAGSTPCGLNNRGALDQVCTAGQWQDTITCVDPDVCTDANTQPGPTPCGVDKVLEQSCVNGQWQDTNHCIDLFCADFSSKPCYTGLPANTEGVGVCHVGAQYCIAGVWGPCIGEVVPAAAESCNNQDDDCDGTPAVGVQETGLGNISCGIGACARTVPACQNGQPGVCTAGNPGTEICGNGIDEDCSGVADDPAQCGCVFVSATGDDNNSGLAPNQPKRTINAGIAVAIAAPANPKAVCVAATANCASNPGVGDFTETVVMMNGISVLGAYQAGNTAPWTRDTTRCSTRILAPANNTDRAVTFDASIISPTTLEWFTVRANDATTNQAIVVDGSTGAIIKDNDIIGGGGDNSAGVRVTSPGLTVATPTLLHNGITGGAGALSSAGVHSVQSAPVISRQCDTNNGNPYDNAGRCQIIFSCGGGATRFIRSRTPNAAGTANTTAYGILLENSPGASVSQNSICSGTQSGQIGGIRISGNASGTLMNLNSIAAMNFNNNVNLNSVGLWLDACAGASPWILNNFFISGTSSTVGSRADGIRAVGDCHPRIDSNVRILGGIEAAGADTNAIYCAKDPVGGLSSRCTILGNQNIIGSQGGFPPTSTGVRCDAGACLRIENNTRITGQQGTLTYGVILNGASTYVSGNTIDAGCPRNTGVGVLSLDSAARIQNNIIYGVVNCQLQAAVSETVRVVLGSATNEIDIHSNNLIGYTANPGSSNCTSRTLVFDAAAGGMPPTGPLGMVRNSILILGNCLTTVGVAEMSTAADPRIFLNNDIFPLFNGQTLYLDENVNALTTIAAVNALTDPAGNSNLSGNPLWVAPPNDYRLQGASPCRNAGTNANAPGNDFLGQARPNENLFDIGAIEYY
jgi:hypothetical protein